MENPVMLGTCSGIGGIELASEWAGFTVAATCEIEPFPKAVLKKHWPDAYHHDDIKTLTADTLRLAGIKRVDLLTGGVPCQPASVAGQRKGKSDDRWLWGEFLRLVRDVRPLFVLAENPRGILSLDRGDAYADIESELEAAGYEVQPVLLAASDVGASHRRERVFIVARLANAVQSGLADTDGSGRGKPRRYVSGTQELRSSECGCISPVADSHGITASEQEFEELPFSRERTRLHSGRNSMFPPGPSGDWSGVPAELWPSVARTQHGVCDLASGVSTRLVRRRRNAILKALGNAVVPQQVYPILKAIHDQLRLDRQKE